MYVYILNENSTWNHFKCDNISDVLEILVLYNTVTVEWDSPWLLSDFQYDKQDTESGINVNGEALELYLYEQSLQTRRSDGQTD